MQELQCTNSKNVIWGGAMGNNMNKTHVVLLLFFTPILGKDIIIDSNNSTLDTKQKNTYKGCEVNRLNWVELSQGPAIQLLFDFEQPIYFKKKFIPETRQLRLKFPGMQLQHFDKKQVLSKLSALKQLGLANQVDLFEKKTKYSKVILTIDFAKTRNIKQEDNTERTVKNILLIKWCKMEEPNRLVFDIFTQEALKKIKSNDTGILYAQNTTIKTDSYHIHSQPTTSKKIRIVIDAGHGGSDNGAQSFGMQEKNLALDIALRTRSLLKKKDFCVFLTRNADNDIPLSARSELANQLNANLMVSIHLNAGGPSGRVPSGVETFHFDAQKLLHPKRTVGYLFINLEKNMEYATLIDKQLKEKNNLSRTLANHIQQQVLCTLRTKNKAIHDRGVKSGLFRIFFNNQIPTTLVEVGFITNPGEAKLLGTPEYRQLIAEGIYNGINSYLSQCMHLYTKN